MASGDLQRTEERGGRGRPVHRYSLTEKGHKNCGENFADLAQVMWAEIMKIENVAIRESVLNGIGSRLTEHYSDKISGKSIAEKMKALAKTFVEKDIPLTVEQANGLPILKIHACPYPDLVDENGTLCEMEQNMFSSLIGEELDLNKCESDGGCCCTFEVKNRPAELAEIKK